MKGSPGSTGKEATNPHLVHEKKKRTSKKKPKREREEQKNKINNHVRGPNWGSK
jgi:hypothetical protein